MSLPKTSLRSENPRPSLSAVLGCSLAFWGTCALALTLLRGVDAGFVLGGIAAGALLGIIALCVLIRVKRNLIVALFLGIGAGVLCACSQAYLLQSQLEEISGVDTSSELTLVALEDASASTYGSRVLCCVTQGSAIGAKVLVSLNGKDDDVRYGDTLTVKASLKAVDFSENEYAWRKGAAATASVYSFIKQDSVGVLGALLQIRNNAIDYFRQSENSSGEVLEAISCGYRYDLNQSEIYDDFKRCGLAHMVAVSGAHLSIVCGLAMSIASTLRLRRSFVISFGVGIAFGYLILAAAPISALRAVVMTVLNLTSFYVKRRASSLNSIGVCLMIMIAQDPLCSLSVSLLLSAFSTLSIILFSEMFSNLISRIIPQAPRSLRDPAALTLAASLSTVPISASLFSQVSLIALISNLVCAPLFPIVCGLGLITGLIGPFLGSFAALGDAAYFGCGLLLWIVHALSQIPYAAIPATLDFGVALFISILLQATLWAFWPRRISLRLFLGVCTLVFAFVLVLSLTDQHEDEIVMLDVDQGDAILIKSNARAMLIDTGNHDTELLSALSRQGITHLDLVLLTHCDDDHCGSLDALQQAVVVDEIVVAKGLFDSSDSSVKQLLSEASKTASSVEEISTGDVITCGDFVSTVISPSEVKDDGANNDSIVLYTQIDYNHDGSCDYTALFTGDAESETIAEALTNAHLDSVDILKESHHGSRTGLTLDLAKRLSARIALISCGANNRYGHPHAEVLDYLNETNTQVFRTDESGDVSCKFEDSGVEVVTLR